jgi:hypothetical protein
LGGWWLFISESFQQGSYGGLATCYGTDQDPLFADF